MRFYTPQHPFDWGLDVQGSNTVNDRVVRPGRRRARETGERHHAANRLPDRVEANAVTIGAVLPIR